MKWKMKIRKNCRTVLGRHFSPRRGTVALAQPMLHVRSMRSPCGGHARGGAVARPGSVAGGLGVARPAGTPRESDGGCAGPGAAVWRRHGGGSSVGQRGHKAKEREEGGEGLLERTLAREDERGKKRGHSGDGVSFISDAVGVGNGPRAAPQGGEAWGAMGAARHGGQQPSHGARRRRLTSAKIGEGGAGRWAPTTVPGGCGLNTIQIQMNSNYFKTFQILTDPKMAFPSPKILK
jgi:hypothetical protein